MTRPAAATLPAGTIVCADSLVPDDDGIFIEVGFPHAESDDDLFTVCQPDDVRPAPHLTRPAPLGWAS